VDTFPEKQIARMVGLLQKVSRRAWQNSTVGILPLVPNLRSRGRREVAESTVRFVKFQGRDGVVQIKTGPRQSVWGYHRSVCVELDSFGHPPSSRSPQRKFEVVIMVEVLLGEMFGSD
jgi:hypothetical protein